jgi:hypothetical protein
VLPVADLGLDELLVQPQAVGGANTQVCYVTAPDVDAHRAQADGAGARIEIEPQDDGLGGRFYTCRDLEGHLWSFGTRTYGLAGADAGRAANWRPAQTGRRSGARVLVRSMAVAAAMAVTAAGGWMAHRTYDGPDRASAARVDGVLEQLAQERKRAAAAESASKDTAIKLAEERERAAAAESASRDAAIKLAQERKRAAAVESASRDAEVKLAEERKRAAVAESASKGAEAKVAEERAAAGDVRRALQQAQAEIAAERRRKGEVEATLAALQAKASKVEQAGLGTQAELAATRERIAQEKALAKAAAERGTALQAQIATLQQERDAGREDLRKARAALQGAQAALEALRAAKPEPKAEPAVGPAPVADGAEQSGEKSPAAPDTRKVGAAEVVAGSVKVPDLPEAKALPKGACASAVLGRRKAPSWWVTRLCQGAEGSPEPALCFDELMRGKVSWGGGKAWTAQHALTLCGGSRNARQTLDCFSGKIAADEPWQAAIKECKSG